MKEEFAAVVPVSGRDAGLVRETLPRWLSLPASEVIICVDEPADAGLVALISEVAGGDSRVRLVGVPRDSGWMFQQAFVRRSGFRAARFDRILTGDIDILVNEKCLKAVDMVGRDNIGIVSLAKRRGGGTVGELIRNATKKARKTIRRREYFTGLYALYRPFWLDSENQEEVKRIPHPYSNQSHRRFFLPG
jgi:hypothetical protein